MSGRGPCRVLVIGFLAAVAAVGPFQGADEWRRGDDPQALDLFRHVPTVAALRSFEKDLEGQSVVAQAVRPWMQYLLFRAFGDTGEQALVGRKGWWFYRPDVRYLTDRCPEDPAGGTGRRAAVAAIVSFRDQLARRGIHLLVVPIPGKPAVCPEMLTRRAAPCDPRVRGHTRAVLADLAAAGVETVDLLAAFAAARAALPASGPGSWYLTRDTHWTGRGARLAAEAVARRIRDLGWERDGPVRYDLQPIVVRRPGDILQMLKCPPIEALFAPEDVRCERVVRQDDGETVRDDAGAAVLVLGDSFLRIYERDEPGSAGFIAHLVRELGQPVTSIVNDGGASTLVRQELARKPGLLAGKTVVIWEFIERDIRFGLEGWQNVPLPDARPSDLREGTRPGGGPAGLRPVF